MNSEAKRIEYFNKLINLSNEDKYDPALYFDWTEELDENTFWMSPELLSIANTTYVGDFDEYQLKKLSRWELINFFSLSVNGERNIKMDMLKYLTTRYFENESEYFIHFLREENNHIFFFSKFCKQYGNKLYQFNKLALHSFDNYYIDRYIVFVQTLIAEEIGDYYNVYMSKDEKLPKIIRDINLRHHQDESRHIGMGRELVKGMWLEIQEKYNSVEIIGIQNYVKKFILNFINDFYNPEMYRDCALKNAYLIRTNLLQNEARKEFNIKISSKMLKFMQSKEMINGDLYS